MTGDIDRTKGPADLDGISAMLSDYAARLPALVDVALKDSFSLALRSKTVDAQLREKFGCGALRPCDISEKVIRNLPGFRELDGKAAEMDVAVTVAVCHFKPGPDAEGLYKIKNPEAVVIVRAEPEDHYSASKIDLYEDVFKIAVMKPLALGRKVADKTAVPSPIKLKIRKI